MTLSLLFSLIKFFGLGAGLGGVLHLISLLGSKAQLSAQWLQIVSQLCQQVAQAVEQSNGSLSGDQKKQLAETIINEILSHMGITVPKILIDTGIEAAVLVINQAQSAQGTPAASQPSPAPATSMSNPAPVPAADSPTGDSPATPTDSGGDSFSSAAEAQS